MARVDSGPVDKPLPRRDEPQRNCRGLGHGQRGGLVRDESGIDRGEFRQRPLHTAHPTGHAEHFVAYLKAVDLSPNGFHHSSHLDAKYRRRCHLGVRGLPTANLGVEWVDTACHHPHEDFTRSGCRAGTSCTTRGVL